MRVVLLAVVFALAVAACVQIVVGARDAALEIDAQRKVEIDADNDERKKATR